MTPLAISILDQAGESLGSGLPRIGAALALLVVGLLVTRLVGHLIMRGLRAAGVDGLAERHGVHDVLARVGLQRSASRVAGRIVRLALSVVVVLAALSLLGLQFLSESLNAGVLLLPRLLVAAVLVLAGVVLGALVRERVERLSAQMDLPVPLAPVAQAAVVAVFAVTALAQVGVPTMILTAFVAIFLAAAALAFALAFGMGNRDVARAIGAGRFVRDAFSVGQTISVDGIRGTIEAIESTGTIVRTAPGTTVHVPNHVLMTSPVEVTEPGS